MIGIIGAMKIETDGIIALIKNPKTTSISNILFTSGAIGKQDVVVATCGVGKVFAAMCAQTMILAFHPDKIINIGVGGALCGSLHICDLVIAEKALQYDMDTSATGDPKGLISGINVIYFECDLPLRQQLTELSKKLNISAANGTIASADRFLSAPTEKEQVKKEFGAIACDMESGAIAQVCYVNQIPVCILRSISDGADTDGAMDYAKFCHIATEQTISLISSLFS